MSEIIDLTKDAQIHSNRAQSHSRVSQDVPSYFNGSRLTSGRLSSFDQRGFTIRRSSDVVLRTGQLLRVTKISRSVWGRVTLKGWLFERNEQHAGCFTISATEICMSVNMIKVSHQRSVIHGLHTKPVEDVIGLCHIIITNLPRIESSDSGIYVCRWKIINSYGDEEARKKNKPDEVIVETFKRDECDQAYSADNDHLMLNWLDDIRKGGSASFYFPGESEHLGIEQKAAKAADSVEVNRIAVRRHMRHKGLISHIYEGPIRTNTSYYPDSDSDDIIEQWSNPSDPSRLEDDECEEMMLPVSAGTASSNGHLQQRFLISHPVIDVEDLDSDSDSDFSEGTVVDAELGAHEPHGNRLETQNCERVVEYRQVNALRPFIQGARNIVRAPLQVQSRRQQRYTVGDLFCGAGGVSRGAVTAGMRVSWACDFDADACRTYSRNFFQVNVYQYSVTDFLAIDGTLIRVDILHLSPPCQFFSIAHTRPGPNDEMNLAAMYCISLALQRCRPRIVTLEEASGLPDLLKHKQYFRSLVRQFTDNGYTVRWAVFRCCDWGIPQQRRRLFLIAAW